MTTRGFVEADMERLAGYLVKAVAITKRVQEKSGKKLVDSVAALNGDEEVQGIADEIKQWARSFSIPGV